MTSKQPPGIATWLLEHFGCGLNIDTVLGDLAEQYVQRDSTMWYWRQTMKAIPVTFFKEIRAHKWIAARALLIGWGMWTVFVMLIYPLLVDPFLHVNSAAIRAFVIEPLHPIGSAWGVLWTPVILSPPGIRIALSFIGWAICGRLVARLHRDTVLLFVSSIPLMHLLFIVPFIRFFGSWAYDFIGPLAANAAISVIGVLLGGGLLRDRVRTANN